MCDQPIPNFVRADLTRLGITVPNEALTQLSRYIDLLLAANEQFNLTAIRDRDEVWRRHIIDSLTLLPGLDLLSANARIIDVGSGGGLPGLPIAMTRPDWHITLLEATAKKARFLEQCVLELGLSSVTVVHGRAETVGQDKAHRQAYDAVVSRALGPMRQLLEYTLPLARVGGRVLAMKGPKVQQELADAGDGLAILGAGDLQVFDAYPEEFDRHTVIVSIIKDRSTPKPYPRPPGMPRQSPL